MKKNFAIGLMSGTSLDGLDVVLIRFQKKGESYKIRVIAHEFAPYSPEWKAMVKRISNENLLLEGNQLGCAWSEHAARTVKKLLKRSRVKPSHVEVIGAHGQTVLHAPHPVSFLKEKIGSTIQLCDISRLALRTGIPTVGNFRTADVAAGGNGAPLVPHAHRMLFGSKPTLVQNMGGIGNVTALQNGNVLTAFDTGPGNIWIDTIIRWFSRGKQTTDWEGMLARKGKPDFREIERLLSHPYFDQKPPKSTGWEDFGEVYLNSFQTRFIKMGLKNSLATVTYATALSVVNSYHSNIFKMFNPNQILICGGGAKNDFLMELLTQLLPRWKVMTTGDVGIPVDQVEAISFALLALQTLNKNPNNEPKATGAGQPVICGQIAYI